MVPPGHAQTLAALGELQRDFEKVEDSAHADRQTGCAPGVAKIWRTVRFTVFSPMPNPGK
jgi:hypothetical protein